VTCRVHRLRVSAGLAVAGAAGRDGGEDGVGERARDSMIPRSGVSMRIEASALGAVVVRPHLCVEAQRGLGLRPERG
jgi:hypothetical protein